MDVFQLRDKVIGDYASYVSSFVEIRDRRIRALVDEEVGQGFLWPDPLVQVNPSFEPGEPLSELVDSGVLHPECLKIFASKDQEGNLGEPFRLHRHQVEAIQAARAGENYVLTTGTGSGKSLSYIVPIVDHVLRNGTGKGIQAIVVYPMNALANSQEGELEKFLCRGYPQGKPPVTFARYTGQEDSEKRNEIVKSAPDILLTNYVMLELVLTRVWDRKLVKQAQGLRFLVFDELHTYRGRQGSDVSLLIRRVREACRAERLLHIGTSATLASGGSWTDQQKEVSRVATDIFGAPVKPEFTIGETLRRVTPFRSPDDEGFLAALRDRIRGDLPPPGSYAEVTADPLYSWIESNLGVAEEVGTGRLIRCQPRALSGEGGAAATLSAATGVEEEACELALRRALLLGNMVKSPAGKPAFAFRLHQFVSKGEAVYASLEAEDNRHITLQGQQFVPGYKQQKILLPLAFCRECGQEYYTVRRTTDPQGRVVYSNRALSDRQENDDGKPGFLYFNSKRPWPTAGEQVIQRIPEAWVDHSGDSPKVGKNFKDRLPTQVFLDGLGREGQGGFRAHYLSAPFRFCLTCGVSYGARQSSDFGKLATLGSEGRSTATTILSLSSVRVLRRDEELEPHARKLLSFTDNRQDASLQAGHFNDFVEISLIRSALLKAVAGAGEEGLRHDNLTRRVFEALDLPLELYAFNPQVEFAQREATDRALRAALGYYLYRDLRRGWRITSPNLEQCGLLTIDYLSLGSFAPPKALEGAARTGRCPRDSAPDPQRCLPGTA
ncbi:MAG: DEAD/DEAH box helicase [Planctomycetota bacterium]